MKKLFLTIFTVVVALSITACYPKDQLIFIEGYFHQESSVQFTNYIYIDEIKLEFTEISNEEYEDSDGINVLKNHKNNIMYRVIFSLRFDTEDELKNYDFEYLGKVPGYTDTYKIVLDLNNENIDLHGTITLSLDFFSAIGSTEETINIAGRLWIRIMAYDLKDSIQTEIVVLSFPRNLEYVKKEENNET